MKKTPHKNGVSHPLGNVAHSQSLHDIDVPRAHESGIQIDDSSRRFPKRRLIGCLRKLTLTFTPSEHAHTLARTPCASLSSAAA